MQFNPRTEKELKEQNLLPQGDYDFTVLEAKEGKNKSHNDMISLKLDVYKPDGNTIWVYDYLLEAMGFKLRHAAEVFGMLDQYESGALNANEMIGKSGKVKIVTQKDKTGQYPDRNTVADYIVDKEQSTQRAANDYKQATGATGFANDLDDELPI